MLVPDQRLHVAGLSDRAALQTPLGHRENLPPTQEQDEGAQIKGLRDEVEEKKQAGRIKPLTEIIVQTVRNFINSALTRDPQLARLTRESCPHPGRAFPTKP